jgi:hypothetical protein
MKKYSLFFLSFLTVSICLAQQSVMEYKAMTDGAIRKYFSQSGFKKVKCYSYIACDRNNGKTYSGRYKKNDSFKIDIEFISIFYDLYSKELDYKFEFITSIDSSMKIGVYTESGGFKDIPPCVRMNKPCHYIKQSEAIIIAQKDSIQYPDNLIVEMEGIRKSDEFYWIVSGQDKRIVDYSVERKEGFQYYPQTKKNTRYVNAKTGRILSFEEYKLLNPPFIFVPEN